MDSVASASKRVSQPSGVLMPKWHYLSFRYRDTCESCRRTVEPGEMGWHDSTTSNILCVGCGKAKPEDAKGTPTTPRSPVGGSSTLRWSRSGNARRKRKGAAGEYLIDARLHRDLKNGEVILNDRRIPNDGGNIDHVVVAHSGVWIIDTKSWEGRIEYKGASGIFDANERLFIGGEDRTYLADDIYAQVIPIAGLLDDRAVPINPAIVFANGNWRSTVRLVSNRPYEHNRVLIAWPAALISGLRNQDH